MMKLALKVFLVVALLGAFPACADLVPWGDPEVTGSYYQGWWHSPTPGSVFDKIVISSADPDFKSPGLIDFFSIPNGWAMTVDTPNTVEAVGPDVSALLFRIHFAGDIGTPVAFTLTSSNDGVQVESWNVAGNGNTWTLTRVPEASTVALRGSWLLGLAALMYRRRRSLSHS